MCGKDKGQIKKYSKTECKTRKVPECADIQQCCGVSKPSERRALAKYRAKLLESQRKCHNT